MATTWREGNRARWIGMRPAHEGEHVDAEHSVVNGTEILYTVGEGKLLLLFESEFDTTATGAAIGYLGVYDATPTRYHYLHRQGYNAAGVKVMALARFIPFEVPAGHSVRVYSSGAALTARAQIYGILIDA